MKPRRPKIMIFEDVYFVRKLISRVLMEQGYEISEFDTGEEGLQKIGAENPDVILLDKNLPGTDGMAILDQMSKSRNRTPVILMSSATNLNVQTIMGNYRNVVDFLAKPVDFTRLKEVIKAAIRNKAKDVQLDRVMEYSDKFGEELLIPKEAKENRKNKTVLVVDDDKFSVTLMRESLVKEGYDVHADIEGINAIFLALNYNVDLIILDIALQNITGYEIMEELQRLKIDIPIIIATGIKKERVQEYLKTIKHGKIHAFLFKPFKMSELARVVNLVFFPGAA